MQSIQNKIDKFIQQGNQAFSEENRVIEALTKYSRAYELYNYLDRKYKVQIHEVLVRIAICWDVLGNYVLAYENLCKALVIIPKIKVLTVYKTALDLIENGIRPVVLKDFCFSSNRTFHKMGLKLLERNIGKENIQ